MKIINKLLIIATASLIGCGTVGVEERKQLREFVQKKDFKKAQEVINKGKIKKDDKSQILYFLEEGRIQFGLGDFGYAAEWFNKARKLIDDYYTKSISQKLASATLNDNLENYYGEIYEVSMLHYYLAKTYYQIYLTGKVSEEKIISTKDGKSKISREIKKLSNSQRKQYLFSARAEILAWDSFYKDVQRSGRNTVFKSDLMVKLFGATIHEAIGSRNDLNTALILYQDAKKVLYTVSNIFKTYNSDYKKYTEDRLKNINKLIEFIPSKNFSPSEYQNQLKDFIDEKIVNLTKRLSPGSLKQIIKREAIKNEIVKKTDNKVRNVSIVVEEGLIAEKKQKLINIGLEGALNSVESPTTKAFIQAVGVPVLSYFAMNTLNLVPKNRAMTYGEFVYGRNMAELAVRTIAIEFEIPMVEEAAPPKKLSVNIYTKDGKKVAEKSLAVVAPLGDIARQNLEESAGERLTKKGIRVAIKHAMAIVAAYQTYKTMKDKGQGAFAGTVASLSYIAAAKGILASEKADIRYWSTLPSNIHMTDLSLKNGEYDVKLASVDQKGQLQEKLLGNLKVEGNDMNIFTYYIGKI